MSSQEFSDSLLFNEITGHELFTFPRLAEFIEQNHDLNAEKLFANGESSNTERRASSEEKQVSSNICTVLSCKKRKFNPYQITHLPKLQTTM